MSGQFRPSVWDPLLVISQIVTIQALYYTSLGILVFIVDCMFGQDPSLSHMFSYTSVTLRTGVGTFFIISFLVNSIIASFYLWYFVKRAKSCLDHAATIHVIHAIASWFFSSFPASVSWWILNVICASVTCVCGEFLCMRTELKSIPLLAKSDV